MKPSGPNIFFHAAAALFPLLLFPAAAGAAGAAGDTAASFLKLDASPRAAGMGSAYTAVAQDAYAAWWNPAGLAALELPEAAAAQDASFSEVSNLFISAAYPLSYGSTLGLHLARQSVASFQGYDAAGGVSRMLEAGDTLVGASYARTLLKDEIDRPVFSVGLSLKSVSEKLDKVTVSAKAADLGAIYSFRPSKYWMKNTAPAELRVGLAVRNLGSGLKFDTQSFPLPRTETLGLAWVTHPAGAHTLTLSADQVLSNYAASRFNLGAEYFMFQLLSLRGGYSSGRDLGSGLSLGLGFRLSFMDLDYSMSSFGELGTMKKLGMDIRFGAAGARQPLSGKTSRVASAKVLAPKEKIEALKVYANDYIELARRNLDAREYSLAVDNLNKAFNLEPRLRNGAWGDKAARLATLNERLQLRETPVREKTFQKKDEQANAAHEAIMAYLDGRELKAFLLAHAALGVNPRGDAVYEELLYNLGDLTRNTVRRDEILPRVPLVKEKLKKVAKAFYIQQFDVAAKECEEVTLLDETNIMAWTRLGSAYYMMGDKDKSRKAYEKVLELNPNDKVTRQFMDAQGWK